MRTFTHSSSLSGLQASTSSSTSHSVCDTVCVFVDDDIVFESSVALGLYISVSGSECIRGKYVAHIGGSPQEHPCDKPFQ